MCSSSKNITETRCPIRYRSRDEAFEMFLTGAIWYMLFCIYEVFEAVKFENDYTLFRSKAKSGILV